LIVPALNESRGIIACLQHLKSLKPPATEILVVDGGSTDRTRSLAAGVGGVRVLKSGRGRARQMNAGAAQAKGEVLVFVHADSRPPENLVSVVRRELSRPGVVLGGFATSIECEDGRVLWFPTVHNFVSTYFPLFIRPLDFFRYAPPTEHCFLSLFLLLRWSGLNTPRRRATSHACILAVCQ
jgi:glycosyltransferase involved in cell wall biosynthesis